MNKKLFPFLLVFTLINWQSIIAQSSTPTFSHPTSLIAGTICPGIEIWYTISIPTGYSTCTVNFDVTNGSKGQQVGNTIAITWDDKPGQKGKITATFGCTNQHNGESYSLEELILSVKDQAWDSYGTSINVDYCNPGTINVFMKE